MPPRSEPREHGVDGASTISWRRPVEQAEAQRRLLLDDETFAPVQINWPNGWRIGEPTGSDAVLFDIVLHFKTYEVLPRSAANLALTDIRAQHPDPR